MEAEIERRSRMHAALGEPMRLGIVDHLSVGDASPGELAAAFGVTTNLLAHHLGVLEEAGLIRRVRSEGDRRRTYAQLCLDDSLVRSLADCPAGLQVPRVVFVCTHNTARSQLATAAWQRLSEVPTTSAGTHPAAGIHPRTVAIGSRHGLRLVQARTAHAAEVLRPDDLVVTVCDNAHEELDAALHWAVSDPVRIDTDAAFERAFQEIVERVERLARVTTSTAVQHQPQ
ncbi:MAG: helix-turn-helix domain-containing protein [Geodermatophilaceae bacterium]|nr:helix-turn-helix domain-containing protein [Geodermatophilaceae bacterium]